LHSHFQRLDFRRFSCPSPWQLHLR
jgi:hypothetical protein